MSFLQQATLFLAAAVVAVPLFKRLGLGSVLGYLTAGILIGPWSLGFITDVDSILHLSELGVVLLLFVIGLELQPRRLWELRRAVFGLGGAQVGLTGSLLMLVAFFCGVGFKNALVAGLGLALSSTAFALQLLAEKNQLSTAHGRSAFAILLFQDLAVIPLLALLPLLGAEQGDAQPHSWLPFIKAVIAFIGVILAGRYLLRPIFRVIAATHITELFTATVLLVVLGTALLMYSIGLSMALGSFMAGVLLADSEYRHAIEADIEPFKGLLMGLFFIAVGMSVNLGLLVEKWPIVLALVIGLVLIKWAALYGLGRFSGHPDKAARTLGVTLCQGGEFAFVLFGVASGVQALEPDLAQLLILVVSISMALTPLVVLVNEKVLDPLLNREETRPFDTIEGENPKVVIAGFGRFGQIIARILRAKRIAFTALDASSEHVDFVRKFGNKIYYGDASRLDLLHAAGLEKAQILVIAVDKPEVSLKIAQTVQQHFPHIQLFVRAYDRLHVYKLYNLGIREVKRET
ncbi:MAG: monovalent cation:proton antiporter-2 (CPA2) family protein, partial [Acidobacteria bacterium]|nr:monovalent cation:proton antiporter-2 (CPA2) family protein [Acidobacteriota bacterium]